jgi:iron(III) transport system permease protein
VRRLDAWTLTTIVAAVLVAGPLLGLPLSFVAEGGHGFTQFSGFLPDAARNTVFLLVGVGTGTLVLGTGLALLVSFCDFPGRAWIEWALALPLAVPGYVFTLFALGTLPAGGEAIRSPLGAIAIFTLVLYPYVYLLGRAAFLSQSQALLEAARWDCPARGRC